MLRNTLIWLPSYLKRGIVPSPRAKREAVTHIMFCIADHFEPAWQKPSYEAEKSRVDRWVKEYPRLAGRFKDADGKSPCHTFFYPEEEYRSEHLDKLAILCGNGFGEVEMHLHHHSDTGQGLKEKLERGKKNFIRHGLLGKDKKTQKVKFGFVHGNWALNNSRNDDKWCGVNNELKILSDAGCYADFTLPSAPDISQTSKINSIYYAKDIPGRRKSHDTGTDVEVGRASSGDLMIIQGPLTLNWKKRKYGIFPRIENGELSYNNIPTKERVDLWVNQRIHVKRRPDWTFVKVYTHGLQERNSEMFLNGKAGDMFSYLEACYNDGTNFLLHYVSAREVFNIIKAAEDGMGGNPNQYRDYLLLKGSG